MVAIRATLTQEKRVRKLAAGFRSSAALDNLYGKTLDTQKQLTEVICQVKLLADKSTNLPDALIGRQDLNEMQGAMDEGLIKLLAEQERSRSAMR